MDARDSEDPAGYRSRTMSDNVNLADPNFEPTDEQLRELSREAFADVGARQRDALARLWRDVATLRAAALARLVALPAADPAP